MSGKLGERWSTKLDALVHDLVDDLDELVMIVSAAFSISSNEEAPCWLPRRGGALGEADPFSSPPIRRLDLAARSGRPVAMNSPNTALLALCHMSIDALTSRHPRKIAWNAAQAVDLAGRDDRREGGEQTPQHSDAAECQRDPRRDAERKKGTVDC